MDATKKQVERCVAVAHKKVGEVFRIIVDTLDDEQLGRLAASFIERHEDVEQFDLTGLDLSGVAEG